MCCVVLGQLFSLHTGFVTVNHLCGRVRSVNIDGAMEAEAL